MDAAVRGPFVSAGWGTRLVAASFMALRLVSLQAVDHARLGYA